MAKLLAAQRPFRGHWHAIGYLTIRKASKAIVPGPVLPLTQTRSDSIHGRRKSLEAGWYPKFKRSIIGLKKKLFSGYTLLHAWLEVYTTGLARIGHV
jgi:hypothetical protein